MLKKAVCLFLCLAAGPSVAAGFTFPSIDGGTIALDDFAGRPVLVVNTASRCAFTPQYDALQALYDQYRAAGLVVLAVPSDDFGGQELASDAAVKEFCAVNFDLDIPMTTIQRVKGRAAHPFFAWAAENGVRPSWNFHKILIDGTGALVADFPSRVRPSDARLRAAIAALLPGSG